MARIVALDTETTGLDPRVHVPWEVAIVDIATGEGQAWCWRPRASELEAAEPAALEVGGFHERAPKHREGMYELDAAAAIADLTQDAVIIGSKPSFDMGMLSPWMRLCGVEPGWHHRPVCVATMAYGWLHGRRREVLAFDDKPHTPADLTWSTLPWRSDDLSRVCGVEPPTEDERHTALGDARWVARWYRALTGDG